MAVVENQFPGINPFLNTTLQMSGGGWHSFHTAHIMHIFELLDTNLPTNYYASPETSIQIATYTPQEPNLPHISQSVADVLITSTGSHEKGTQSDGTVPTLTLPIARLILEDQELSSIVIYQEHRGTPITRIELLSPANLPGGSHYGSYLLKREETLRAGLRLVEIDYLHLSRPILGQIPSYVDQHQDSFPYHIIISDPRPTLLEGRTDVFSFSTMEPIPKVFIPLDYADKLEIDLQSVYDQTFSKRAFSRLVTYDIGASELSGYHELDRQLIRQHIQQLSGS